MKAYSQDLRDRAINMYNSGIKRKEISKLLSIHYETIRLWIRMYLDSGDYSSKQHLNYNSKRKYNNDEVLTLIIAVATLIAVSLSCDLLYFFWFKVYIFDVKFIFALSALFYPLKFALIDLINRITTYKVAIKVAVIITLADGIFSIIPLLTHMFPSHQYIPKDSLIQLSDAVHILTPHIFDLFYHGIFASFITLMLEIYLFNIIIKKVNNLPIAIIISTMLTLLAHNLVLDYSMLKDYKDCWNIIMGNYTVNSFVVVVYALIIYFITKRVIKI